ncbi:hypothetical protein [Thauera propionica]|uniref:hypothetical protein n=1 Tax=Thauera propionica TaxID=2019431 RepID=UPI0023F05F84|nr:hypothetical protein [Thauera propionica]MDD3676036.1 hypothetical protein [Thauera propionica]
MAAVVTHLPAGFAGKPPLPIKRKTRVKRGFRRLPFVAGRSANSAAPCWNVPASGGYFGGYETGEAMAQAFLKFLREEEGGFPAYWLTFIVESFMIRFEQEGGKAMADRVPCSERSETFVAFRGQYCGFLNTVSQWLAASAKHLGASLDRISEQDLVRRANAGLGFDQAAYMASLFDGEE